MFELLYHMEDPYEKYDEFNLEEEIFLEHLDDLVRAALLKRNDFDDEDDEAYKSAYDKERERIINQFKDEQREGFSYDEYEYPVQI